MGSRITVDVSPTKETNSCLCNSYKVTFSEPVNGNWLLDIIFQALENQKRYIDEIEETK